MILPAQTIRYLCNLPPRFNRRPMIEPFNERMRHSGMTTTFAFSEEIYPDPIRWTRLQTGPRTAKIGRLGHLRSADDVAKFGLRGTRRPRRGRSRRIHDRVDLPRDRDFLGRGASLPRPLFAAIAQMLP